MDQWKIRSAKSSIFWLWLIFCLKERKRLGNFDRGPYEEHMSEIILNLSVQFRGRCYLKNLLLGLAAILFGVVELFGQFGMSIFQCNYFEFLASSSGVVVI